MAEKDVSVQVINRAGLEADYLDSSSTPTLTTGDFSGTGDQFLVPNNGRTFLHVKNGATDVTVTIRTPQEIDGLAVTDRAVAVSANSEEFMGPFPVAIYGSPFQFAVSSVSNVEIAALRAS